MRVILIGGGEVVYFLSRIFISRGQKVTIINKNYSACMELAKSLKALVINGDGTDPKIQEQALARETGLLIAVTPFDYVNLACCQTASKIHKVPRTLALVSDPDNYEIFRNLGISHVFNQTDIIAAMLEQESKEDYIVSLLHYPGGKFFLNELHIKEGMPAISKTITELGLPDGARIIGKNKNEKLEFLSPDYTIEADDRILLITGPESHGPALRIIAGQEA